MGGETRRAWRLPRGGRRGEAGVARVEDALMPLRDLIKLRAGYVVPATAPLLRSSTSQIPTRLFVFCLLVKKTNSINAM